MKNMYAIITDIGGQKYFFNQYRIYGTGEHDPWTLVDETIGFLPETALITSRQMRDIVNELRTKNVKITLINFEVSTPRFIEVSTNIKTVAKHLSEGIYENL